MFFVYILRDSENKIYIGYTKDLYVRMTQHKMGKTFTTKKMKNIELYYYESYLTESLAREREKKLKQFGSSYMGLMKRIGLK